MSLNEARSRSYIRTTAILQCEVGIKMAKVFDMNEKKIVLKALGVFKSSLERAKTKSAGDAELTAYYDRQLAAVANVVTGDFFKE